MIASIIPDNMFSKLLINNSQSVSSNRLCSISNSVSFGNYLRKDSFEKDLTPKNIIFNDELLKKQNELYRTFLSCPIDSMGYKEISSNSKIYKYSKNPAIIIKVKHQEPGIENGVVKQISNEFDNEVKILSSLPKKFKNRLKIVGYSLKNGSVNTIATEFIDGKKLDANLKNIDASVLKNLYNDFLILDGNGIYHRDLTTYNILVDKTKTARIVDYGSSKTFSEMERLSNSGVIKYKMPGFIALSNLRNFEENGLLVYLKQLQSQSPKGRNEAELLFEEHLKLKADYYAKHLKILEKQETPAKSEKIKNDLIYKNTYELFKNKNFPAGIKNEIMNIEKLCIKMNHAQKRVRLYNDNTLKNPVTALYWYLLECSYTKGLMKKSLEYAEKYKNNSNLQQYFYLQNKIGKFHYNEIFLAEYTKRLSDLNLFLVGNVNENLETILNEDNLLKETDSKGNWSGPCLPIYKIDTEVSKADYFENFKF